MHSRVIGEAPCFPHLVVLQLRQTCYITATAHSVKRSNVDLAVLVALETTLAFWLCVSTHIYRMACSCFDVAR